MDSLPIWEGAFCSGALSHRPAIEKLQILFSCRANRSLDPLVTFIYKSAALPLSFGQPVCATCLAADTTFFVRGAFFTGGGAAPAIRIVCSEAYVAKKKLEKDRWDL